MALDLKELEKKLTAALDRETPESLSRWLELYDLRNKISRLIYEYNDHAYDLRVRSQNLSLIDSSVSRHLEELAGQIEEITGHLTKILEK